ncbi:chemotaxis protein CheW [Paenibacillus eucommiae]|uniref:Purine-binding chemotaxis protein CheW n=1 Tax=Paenibacillus eucommiae TaxID=1355755 RepID=A0ABS4IT51_9BACL|nr:chemotaxis protein CheW [Paenibacillus eucommiae]MBP1990688.1 purine-binding chemotaxis protein CheW [Paenibacillus eucommiae]
MTTVQQDQYIEMTVGKESYAIRIEEIHEIIKMQAITDIPQSKHYVKGVINLRGKVVPVVSLRSLFSLPDEAFTKNTRIVVVRHQEESIGIIVDQVNKVTTYPEIGPPPERVSVGSSAYFQGIGLCEGSLVGILKLDDVLIRD